MPPPSPSAPAFLECLGEKMILQLAVVRPEVRRMVEHLVSKNAVARTLGLDGIFDLVLNHDVLLAPAPEALPFLLTLATSPRYPHASAVLTRLGLVIDAIDDPPRSLAGRLSAEPLAVSTWQVFEDHLSGLLRVARSSRDPEASRAAVHMISHFPSADAELEPVLFALLSGARDEQDRARLLYALARVQSGRGAAFHPRIERALTSAGVGTEKAAVAIALAELSIEEPLRTRVESALVELAEASEATRHWADPRAWGGRYVPELVLQTLARLRGRT